MTLGDRIKALRETNGLTQTEVAKYLHTQKQTIYKYENNIITNIPYNKILLAADLFDVSPSYLMGWEDSNKSKPKEKEESKKAPLDPLENEILNKISSFPYPRFYQTKCFTIS